MFFYYGDGDVNHFLYSDFAYNTHPSYLSMYVVFSISIFMFVRMPFLPSSLKMLFILFLSTMTLLIMSKMGIVVLVIVLFYYLAQKSSKKQLLTRSLILLLSLSIIFLTAYKYSALFHGKINMMAAELTHTSSDTYLYSTGIRLVLWDSAFGLIQENFFLGVGTGDVRDASMAYSQRMNYPAQLGDLNVHNQFLQSFVAGGIIGFLILLFVIIYPLVLAIRQKEHLFILFFVIIIFNFFVESMLQRQMGVVFYSVFSSLIYAYMISPPSDVEKAEVYSD
jgi:O-antigen ligase